MVVEASILSPLFIVILQTGLKYRKCFCSFAEIERMQAMGLCQVSISNQTLHYSHSQKKEKNESQKVTLHCSSLKHFFQHSLFVF